MFAIPRAKVHFFFEICKRKIIFPQKSSISCVFFPRRKKKEKEKDAAGAAWRPVIQG